ncbi:MAG: cytidylate kinase-like family protein [Oscillospiraceae bacterium]|nr:cytidylate kinase-like family protein [Oscillospiraceae bacterium]
MSCVVTFTREYGSGGRIVAKMLSEQLGIPFYDREIIKYTAEKSGFTEEFVREAEEKKTASLLYSLYMTSLPVSDQIFLAQSQVIQEIARQGSCVIVGNCADYILRDERNCLNVFIYAPLNERIARVRDEYKDISEDIRTYVLKQDKKRITYYNYFTQNKWGHSHNYHLSINSALGLETCVDITAKAAIAMGVKGE